MSQALSIGALSRSTGIPVETLRTWERRYGSPQPLRKPSGHRLYPPAAVDHLRRIRRLLAHGHRPAEIVGLSERELDALLSLVEAAPAPAPRAPGTAPEPGDGDARRSIQELIRATLAFDRMGLLNELQAGWAHLGPVRFLEQIAGAFMLEVGRRWKAKEFEVAHEHFAFGVVSDFLTDVREPYDRVARGPRIVAATLSGDAHEGGLLHVALLLAQRGYRIVYLGADSPIGQIAAAARASGAETVVVSVSAALRPATAARAIAELRRIVPRGVELWIGGAGAPPTPAGVERYESLTALDAHLRASRS